VSFPRGFVWGGAASSYQIEGAANADGRGPSIWDEFCAKPGAIWGNGSGAVACDHYNRMPQDVAMMKDMGLRAYRFSVSWPRVLPDGVGHVNEKGLDFYSRLVDRLLAAGIAPYCTLFHWDYPAALERRGGWLGRESAGWFAEYAAVVAKRLGDRVRHWMTLNEPQVFIKFGLGDGVNAPGLRLPLREQLVAAHHVLLAHGMGVSALRSVLPAGSQIGWAVVCVVKYPATTVPADIEAARRATNGSSTKDLWNNSWWNDPVFFGEYPAEVAALYGDEVPELRDADMRIIRQPMDFLGVNIYEGQPVRAGADGAPAPVERGTGHPLTAFRWPVEPQSLHWGPRFMHERYGVPVYITENGLSNVDWISLDGAVRDPQRIDFTRRYLIALRDAIRAGADVRGYFHWSVMDNFEWAAGYRERFGLVYVDYPSQRRVLKDSAHWYNRVIETNGAALDAG